jgi:hypothetical protein
MQKVTQDFVLYGQTAGQSDLLLRPSTVAICDPDHSQRQFGAPRKLTTQLGLTQQANTLQSFDEYNKQA